MKMPNEKAQTLVKKGKQTNDIILVSRIASLQLVLTQHSFIHTLFLSDQEYLSGEIGTLKQQLRQTSEKIQELESMQE